MEIRECKPITGYFHFKNNHIMGLEIIDRNSFLESRFYKGRCLIKEDKYIVELSKEIKDDWGYIEMITRAFHFPPFGQNNLILKEVE